MKRLIAFFCKHLGEVSQSCLVVLVGDFSLPDVCWKYSTAEGKQSRRFIECMDEKFLTQLAAGNAVKRASDNLVRAAKKAAFGKAEDDDVVVKTKFVGSIVQIIAAQEEMLKKERELEEARKKLPQIHQQQYKFLPTVLREDEG